MDSVNVTATTFAIICAGAALGFLAKNALREHHLSSGTQDTVKLATGVIATLTALVLGLLIASAKQSLDARVSQVRTFVIHVTLLDRSMRLYEPPLSDDRQALAMFAKAMGSRLWGPDTAPAADVLSQLDQVRNKFRRLDPQTPHDKALKDRYLALSDVLILAGNELLESDAAGIPVPIIGIVDGWLGIIFLGFGLFAPFNRVSVLAMIVGAGAVALALFLIIEMNSPFQGFITIPQQIMDDAVAQISKA